MIFLESDYNNGAHPMVMEHLFRTNDEITNTYGFDKFSEDAKRKIMQACECPEAQVFFLTGGTQTNATVIDGMLQSYEAVVTVETGHISIHEAGAVEASGHKVIALKDHEGKLSASDLRAYMEWFSNDESKEHLAQPGMAYISFPTELGTLYSAEEISDIHQVCKDYGLHFFIDGARMGYGLAASPDITLPWLSQHCDVFYIGGTKVGTLCGEAVVFTHQNAPKHFFTIIKRHGALLAKGRLTGVQFDALFSDNLYLRISRHAIDMAMRLKSLLTTKGYQLYIDSPTNQQFVVIPNKRVKTLEKHVAFTHWGPYDPENMICRFVTSWATTDADLDALKKVL